MWAENWGRGYAPLGKGSVNTLSNSTMWPVSRSTCMPSFIFIHPVVWPQYTNVTDKQDRETDRTGQT